MITRVGKDLELDPVMTVGTHDGIFHCDEVVATAILEIANIDTDQVVVRTRNSHVLDELDIVIDIGGGQYDHHMAGFNVRRPTGELYASAGLVWEEFGFQAIMTVAEISDVTLSDEDIKTIKEEIDREVIIPVDQEDNGEKTSTHIFSFIPCFLPAWMDKPDYDFDFEHVESIVGSILYKVIRTKVAKMAAKYELAERYEDAEDGILEIPAQTMPWLENVVAYNQEHGNAIRFVVFPYPAGGWAAQCVPPSIEKKFEQLVPFPKEWAGGNETTLPIISGIPDATFCHNGRFFIRAKSKESILEMCRIAMK